MMMKFSQCHGKDNLFDGCAEFVFILITQSAVRDCSHVLLCDEVVQSGASHASNFTCKCK